MGDERRRPRVYVVNRSTHDYSAAERYGELVYVTKGFQKRFAVGQHTRRWQEALKDSQPDDFIILSSINIICSIGCSMFAAMHGRLNLLLWNDTGYIKREVHLSEVLASEKVTPMWAVPLLEDYVKEAKKNADSTDS